MSGQVWEELRYDPEELSEIVGLGLLLGLRVGSGVTVERVEASLLQILWELKQRGHVFARRDAKVADECSVLHAEGDAHAAEHRAPRSKSAAESFHSDRREPEDFNYRVLMHQIIKSPQLLPAVLLLTLWGWHGGTVTGTADAEVLGNGCCRVVVRGVVCMGVERN